MQQSGLFNRKRISIQIQQVKDEQPDDWSVYIQRTYYITNTTGGQLFYE